jgi:hypothetical protein
MRRWKLENPAARWLLPDRDGPSRSGRTPEEGGDIDIFPAIEPEGPVNDNPDDDLPPVQPFIGKSDPVADEDKIVTRIEIPARTILKIIGSIFAVWLVLQITQILLLVFISFLLALALVPPVRYLQNRGMPRPAAAGVTFLVLIGLIVGYFAIIVPPLVTQGQSFIDNFPDYVSRFERLIDNYPSLNERYLELKENGTESSFTLPWSSVLRSCSGVLPAARRRSQLSLPGAILHAPPALSVEAGLSGTDSCCQWVRDWSGDQFDTVRDLLLHDTCHRRST